MGLGRHQVVGEDLPRVKRSSESISSGCEQAVCKTFPVDFARDF